jgi:hypothetical protein
MHTYKHRIAITYLKAVCAYAEAVAECDAQHGRGRRRTALLCGWMAARTNLHRSLYTYANAHNLRITH